MVLARALREGVDGRPREDRGRHGSDAKQAPKGFAAGLIGALIPSFVLVLFLNYGRNAGVGFPTGILGGVVIGFPVWFGFLMTTGVSGAIFEGRSGKLVGINLGFSLVAYLLMGAVLAIWL